MKILFVLNNTYNSTDANFSLALNVMLELKKNDCEIIALGNTDCIDAPLSEAINGIQYERFFYKENSRFHLLMKKYYEKKYNRMRKMLGLVLHPLALLSAFKYYLFSRNICETIYVAYIEKIVTQKNIDIIIPVSNPYVAFLATAKANVSCKRIGYQLDPHSYRQFLNENSKEMLDEENYVYSKFDKLLVTDLIYEENKTNELSKYKYKMECINFPNVRKLELKQVSNDIVFDKNLINCVFVGYFYDNIRNPEFIFDMFTKLKNDNIVLHVVGGGAEQIVKQYNEILKNRLVIHGKMPLDIALNAMLNADILINIGNKISNQMPSKIFDYISTGKPIVNFCKLDDCPTLKHTGKYPLCIDIFESKGLSYETINQFETFCNRNKGKKIKFNVIKELYYNYTVEYIGEQFGEVLNEVIKKESNKE